NTKENGIILGGKSKITFKEMNTNTDFQVVDMKGSIIKIGKCESSNFSVPVTQKGVYVVQISKNNKPQQTVKVICR
ncbi:MAG: hypothetical protein CR965_02580, partial [Paludibacter sp.]